MKKFLLALMMLCSMCAVAQDVIVKTDGSTIVCRVQDLTTTEVVYKKWSDLNGANYVMNLKDVSTINYENGRKDQLSIMKNKYEPGNQNDGLWRMNDNALVLMDMASNKPQKKAKVLKRIGLFGGGLLFIAGGVLTISSIERYDNGHGSQFGSNPELLIPGCICLGAAIIGGGTCLILSHNYQKQADLINSCALIQQDVSFKNGSSLALSVDMLKDNSIKTSTLGMGLKYNF